MADEDVDVLIAGAGVAGLVAARALGGRGARVAVWEAGDRAGGVVRTERENGFLLEAGPDSILVQKPEGIALCRELGLEERLVPTNPADRTVFVLHEGRLHRMPDGMVLGVPTRPWTLLGSGLLSARGKLRMAMEPFIPVRRGGGDESIGAFFERRFGREARERLGDPLLGGIHAGDAGRLSLRSTFPRLLELEQKYGSLVRGFRAAAAARGASGGGPAFVSLRSGMSELVEALVGALPAGVLRLQHPVQALRRDGDTFVVESPAASVRARAAVLALPAWRASPLLSALAPLAAEAASGIRFASSATVLLGFRAGDVGHPLSGYGFVIPPSAKRRTTACTFVSSKLKERAPEGHVLVRAFLGGMRDPDVLAASDDALVATALGDVGSVLAFRGTPVLARVFRYPQSTPQMEVGHAERVAAIEAGLARVPGLFVTGGGLRGTGLPDVIADATRVAGGAHEYLAKGDRT